MNSEHQATTEMKQQKSNLDRLFEFDLSSFDKQIEMGSGLDLEVKKDESKNDEGFFKELIDKMEK